MTSADGIRTDLGDIVGALEANGYDEVRVEFVPEGRGADTRTLPWRITVIDAARGAVEAAAAVPGIWAERPSASRAGVSVRLKNLEDPQALDNWLAAFAAGLRGAGLAGLLHATPASRLPRSVTDFAEPWLSVFTAFDGVLAGPGAADPVAAQAWCEAAVGWAARTGGDTYVSSSGLSQLDTAGEPGQTAGLLLAALHARSLASVACVNDRAGRAAHLGFDADGSAVYQSHDSAASPAERVARARDALLADAERTRYGCIAPLASRAFDWSDRVRALPPLPDGVAAALRNSPQWTRCVPDVHGMQLLTDDHLNQLPGLEGWTVTEVAPGRHLVEAPETAAWFAPGGPSDELLHRARADFAPVILPVDGSGHQS